MNNSDTALFGYGGYNRGGDIIGVMWALRRGGVGAIPAQLS
jgi:hypothetical protein